MQQTTQDRKSNPRKHTGFTTVELFMAQEAFAYYMQIHPDSRTKSNPYKMLQKLMQQKNGLKGLDADIQFKWRKLYRGGTKWTNAIHKGVQVDRPSWGGGRLGCLKRVISYLKSLNRKSYTSCHIYRMLRATAWGYGWEFKAEPRKKRVDSDKLRNSFYKNCGIAIKKKLNRQISSKRKIKFPSTVKVVSGFSVSRYGALISMPTIEIRKVGKLLVGESRVQKSFAFNLPKKIRVSATKNTEKISDDDDPDSLDNILKRLGIPRSPISVMSPTKDDCGQSYNKTAEQVYRELGINPPSQKNASRSNCEWPGVIKGFMGQLDVSGVRLEDYPRGSFDPDTLPSAILDRLRELHYEKYGVG